MAGVKGRSGGARPGAGRKKKVRPIPPDGEMVAAGSPGGPQASAGGGGAAPAGTEPVELDSLGYLRRVINDPKMDALVKVRAAITLAQYEHRKIEDGGIKPQRQKAAAEAGAGKFAPAAPPLRLVNRE